MPVLDEKLLDEYTVFLAKYGKYIVDEVAHCKKIVDLIEATTAEQTASQNSQDEREKQEKEKERQEEEKAAFEYAAAKEDSEEMKL